MALRGAPARDAPRAAPGRPGPLRRPGAWSILKRTFSQYIEDEAPRRGAALAYYTIFSLAPLVLILVAIVGIVFGPEAAQGLITERFEGLIGRLPARALEEMVQSARRPASGAWASALGVATLLLGASVVVGELQSSLSHIWGAAPEGGGIKLLLRNRLLSAAFVLALGFLLLVSLVLGAAISAAGKYLAGLIHLPEAALHSFNQAFTLLVVALLFALMFRYITRARFPWRDVCVGGVVTATLFAVGNFVLGLYLGKGGPASAYGAAGSVLAILLWAYYNAQILYFGAEFTQAYAEARGSRPVR